MVTGIIGLFLAFVMGCQGARQATPVPNAPDSLLGTVAVTGTEFEQRVVLRSANGILYLLAEASDSAALSRMGGVQVEVWGRRSPNAFVVNRFIAVSVNGTPVADGFVKSDGGGLVLETSHGRVPLGNPPVALRTMIGARVWIGGPLDKGPNFYGLIVPPP